MKDIRQTILSGHAAGTLNPQAIATRMKGEPVGHTLLHNASAANESGSDLPGEMRGFESESPVPTDLSVTFVFRRGPWTQAQRYQWKKDVITFLEDACARKHHAASSSFLAIVGLRPDDDIALYEAEMDMAESTILVPFLCEGPGLPLKSIGSMTLRDFKKITRH
jgi:hypothetical protein